MATQTDKRSAEVKVRKDSQPGVPDLNGIVEQRQEPSVAENVEEENGSMATTETLGYLQPTPQGLLVRIVNHVRLDMLGAVLTRRKRSERDPTSIRRPRAVGVLPADWAYITEVAARTQKDVWTRLIMGEGREGNHRWD